MRLPRSYPWTWPTLNAGLTDSGSTLSVPGSPNAVTTAPSGRQEKIYTGLTQVLYLDNAEEDAHSLYGGLSTQCSSHACRAHY